MSIEIERDDLSDLPEIQKLIQKRPESSLSTAMIWPLMLKMKTIAA